jgi:uncharacterized protein
MRITGRRQEINTLQHFLNSDRPEFLAVYGRRRIGKTFLIRSFFEEKVKDLIFFESVGLKKGTLSEQIGHFTEQIGKVFYQGASLEVGKNWDKTFGTLTTAIESIKVKKKIVLFFDEFPWMATKNSRLIQNLDYYWNMHWSRDPRIKLIICGSSASWIIEKIVNNKGGLHNRLTGKIFLEPFGLYDMKRFLKNNGINLNNRQITEIYMTTGGVPYYLSKIKRGLSAAQNIEQLAFRKKSFFMDEFENLFSSLFDGSDHYVEVIRHISKFRYGVGQEQLFSLLDPSLRGKGGKTILKGLEDASFILSFKPHLHRKKGIYYRVIDEYTLFYLNWIEPLKDTLLKQSLAKGFWEKSYHSPSWYSWSGYAFEAICYKHISQISQALELSPTAIPNTWRYLPKKGMEEKGAQIDLLFDRDDGAITLCEIKYTSQPFAIDKTYAEKLKQKSAVFKERTRTDKQIFLAMISASGLQKTIYSEEMIDRVVTLEDLFAKVQ